MAESPAQNWTMGAGSVSRHSAFRAILYGGFLVGLLDSLDANIAYGLKGLTAVQILQYIASGLLGPSAFNGGLATAALGLILHFFIAFAAAAVYFIVAKNLSLVRRRPVLSGLFYGVGVYLFMNVAVLPLSRVPKAPPSLALTLNGLIGHALLVGLPIALISSSIAFSNLQRSFSNP
jgi:hypothetical protein